MKSFCRAVILTAVLAGCAARAPAAFTEPSRENITTQTEIGRGSSPSQVIYVVNQSSEPIIVNQFTLTACENIRQRCEPREVNIRVEPGGRAVIYRVEPSSTLGGYSYKVNFSWRKVRI